METTILNEVLVCLPGILRDQHQQRETQDRQRGKTGDED